MVQMDRHENSNGGQFTTEPHVLITPTPPSYIPSRPTRSLLRPIRQKKKTTIDFGSSTIRPTEVNLGSRAVVPLFKAESNSSLDLPLFPRPPTEDRRTSLNTLNSGQGIDFSHILSRDELSEYAQAHRSTESPEVAFTETLAASHLPLHPEGIYKVRHSHSLSEQGHRTSIIDPGFVSALSRTSSQGHRKPVPDFIPRLSIETPIPVTHPFAQYSFPTSSQAISSATMAINTTEDSSVDEDFAEQYYTPNATGEDLPGAASTSGKRGMMPPEAPSIRTASRASMYTSPNGRRSQLRSPMMDNESFMSTDTARQEVKLLEREAALLARERALIRRESELIRRESSWADSLRSLEGDGMDNRSVNSRARPPIINRLSSNRPLPPLPDASTPDLVPPTSSPPVLGPPSDIVVGQTAEEKGEPSKRVSQVDGTKAVTEINSHNEEKKPQGSSRSLMPQITAWKEKYKQVRTDAKQRSPTEATDRRVKVFSVDEVPDRESILEAATCFVKNEDGNLVCFGDFFPKRSNNLPEKSEAGPSKAAGSEAVNTEKALHTKTIVFFIRHFWCGQCQDYTIASLSTLDPVAIEKAGIRVVVISNGSWKIIKAYRRILKCPFDIYVDGPRKLYKLMGMTKMTNDFGPWFKGRAAYHQRPVPTQLLHGLGNACRMPLANPGVLTQLGGEFIFSTNYECEFAHRMTNTSDHVEAPDVVRAAGMASPTQRESYQANLTAAQKAELANLEGDMEVWREERAREIIRMKEKKAQRRGQRYRPSTSRIALGLDSSDVELHAEGEGGVEGEGQAIRHGSEHEDSRSDLGDEADQMEPKTPHSDTVTRMVESGGYEGDLSAGVDDVQIDPHDTGKHRANQQQSLQVEIVE